MAGEDRSLLERLAGLPARAASAALDGLVYEERRRLFRAWGFVGRDAQIAPEGAWRTWLILAGRGFGKTRAGAEWVSALARSGGRGTRIALVGATMAETRAVMVEGESGLLGIGGDMRPRFESSIGRLVWPNGATAFLYSSEAPEALRGPQHHFAWCDELAKWRRAETCWDNLALGLRLGAWPRALVTTTPRAGVTLERIMAAPDTVIHRGRMADNRALPPAFVATMAERYGGTRIGRQELDGELIGEAEGALWTRAMLEACRVPPLVDGGALRRVVVGVDPPASASGDACGIVAVGLGADGAAYVLGDHSLAGARPEGWARAVAAAAEAHGADRVVAEANNGGEMVESVLRAADAGLPVRLVHASRGKTARAEPVAALYEAGRVRHAGAFPALEDELAGLIAGGGYEGPGRSPDRADALVWAVTELMLGRRGAPSVRAM